MKVVIAKVDQVLYEGEAYSLTVSGSEGQMTVLSHHEPLITTLKKGEASVRIERDTEPQRFAVDGGILEVHGNGATVIL